VWDAGIIDLPGSNNYVVDLHLEKSGASFMACLTAMVREQDPELDLGISLSRDHFIIDLVHAHPVGYL
jgi:hypothetical protein